MMLPPGRMRVHELPGNIPLPRLRRRLRRHGRLRQARLWRRRDRRDPARRPLRAGRGAVLGAGARGWRRRGDPSAAPPRRRRGPCTGRGRLCAPGRVLFRSARAHRRVAAVALALHVPGDRRRGRRGPWPRAARRAALGCPGPGLRRARSRRGRRRGRRARSARRRARARGRGGLQHLHPRQRRNRRAHAAAGALGTRLHRRGRVVDGRLGAARPAASRRSDGGRLGLACLPRRSLDRRGDQPLLRRPRAGRADHRLDPRHGRATRDGAARLPRLRGDARGGTGCRRRSRSGRRAGATGGDLQGRAFASETRSYGMSKPLEGKVALVSGATRGGGRGIAVALGEAGATVYATGRSTRERRSEVDRPETIEETAELVTEAGGEGIAVAVDHLDPEQVRALIERIDAEHGRLDVLVNDVWGAEHLFQWDTPVWEHDLDNGLRLLRLAIHTHLITSHHALPLLVRRPGGLVVEVTDGTAAYNADHYRVNLFYDLAKTSVTRVAWAQAQELRPHGGTAVALTPGWMRSEQMLENHRVSESNWREATERSPHFCISETPRYVGRAVAALAGDPEVARWNGQSLSSGQLAQVYGFTDLDGTRPDCWRYMVEVVEVEGATPGDAGYR